VLAARPVATIAVIDSNPTERATVTAWLRRAGHDVREWARVTPSRHALRECGPDLLLVASELPDGSGVDLAAQLRARFPVVVVSADVDDGTRAAAAGAAALALRPLELDPLLRLVDRLLEPPRRDDKERGGALARACASSQPKGAQARPHEAEGLSVGSGR
jgi:DNA-binding response OmpR family regulator